MKLATEKTGHPDGRLLVVSRDLRNTVEATAVSATLQAALDNWDAVAPALHDLYTRLNHGEIPASRPYEAITFSAPLPRAWQWLDGSAFPVHGDLMARAFNKPPIVNEKPLMYQGMSHRFLATGEDAAFLREADQIDFEGEFGVITGPVPMGTSATETPALIRLVVLINDWSLRRFAVPEMQTGFGWIQAKPACGMAPLAITPDELEDCWLNNRITASLAITRNGEVFGNVPADEMAEGFNDLVAHAAGTRDLCPGTIIGSGTVSHSTYSVAGSCCIAERRAIEMIDTGQPVTGYLQFGEKVCMEAFHPQNGGSLFGRLVQRVVQA